MPTPTPSLTGGWITGRFYGHYEAPGAGLVRRGEVEVRPLRLLRGTLRDARFSPFGPAVDGGALRQAELPELWVAAGTGDDGHPRWHRCVVRDVWVIDPVKGADELHGATGLGEVEGTLWARLGEGEEARIGAPEPVPDHIPTEVGG